MSEKMKDSETTVTALAGNASIACNPELDCNAELYVNAALDSNEDADDSQSLDRYLNTTSPTYILKDSAEQKIDIIASVNHIYEAFCSQFKEMSFLCYKEEQHTCTLKAKSSSGSEYAVKTLLLPPGLKSAEEKDETDKFSAEIDLTYMMNNFLRGEGIAKVVSYGTKKLQNVKDTEQVPKQVPYFVTEYCKGGDLETIAVQDFPLSKKISIFTQVACNIAFMHKYYNIIHRDLKPTNIMLTDKEMPVIIDFGSFEIIGRKYRTSETGTKPYFSPTQAKSMIALKEYMQTKKLARLPEHTYRTDMYSFTLVMADVIFGGRGDNTVEIINELYQNDDAYYYFIASDPLMLFPDSGIEDLDKILSKGISNHPQERFSSMQEMADALLSLQGKL